MSNTMDIVGLGGADLSGTSVPDPLKVDLDRVYRCHICIFKEEDDTFSAIVLNLPGAGSCGDTKEETIANVKEAVLGVIEAHSEAGEAVPWVDSLSEEIPDGAEQKWILVHG